jgi:hypothetical protein
MKRGKSIQVIPGQAFMKAGRLVMLLLLLSPAFAKAQREKVRTNFLWLGHYSTITLSNRFAVNSDVQVRIKDWTEKWSQQLIRSGLSYKPNSHLSFTAGGAWFRHAQYTAEKLLFRNEWRPWLEVAYGDKWKKSTFMQRMRLEERFIQKVVNGQKIGNYDQITRLRYRLEYQVPLKGSTVTGSLVNEFMVHPGHIGSERFLDQNRTFVGLNVKVAPSTILQTQYMKIFMWRTNNLLEDQNVLRFNIHQQFNWKK